MTIRWTRFNYLSPLMLCQIWSIFTESEVTTKKTNCSVMFGKNPQSIVLTHDALLVLKNLDKLLLIIPLSPTVQVVSFEDIHNHNKCHVHHVQSIETPIFSYIYTLSSIQTRQPGRSEQLKKKQKARI